MTKLEDKLYASLKMCPCKCTYTWKVGPYSASQHDTLEGRIRSYTCTRCEAVEAYEKVHGA